MKILRQVEDLVIERGIDLPQRKRIADIHHHREASVRLFARESMPVPTEYYIRIKE